MLRGTSKSSMVFPIVKPVGATEVVNLLSGGIEANFIFIPIPAFSVWQCDRQKQKKQIQTSQSENIARIGDRYYRKLDGIWYCITFQELPSLEKVRDVIFKEFVSPQVAAQAYGRAVYAASKRQCNKKEIKIILAKVGGDVAQRIEHHSSKVIRAGSNPAILVMGL